MAYKLFIVVSLIVMFAVDPLPGQAAGDLRDDVAKGLENAGGQGFSTAGVTGQEDLAALAGNVVAVATSLVGVIYFLVLAYAGWLWLSAGGNEEQVTKAKTFMINGTIGVALVAAVGIISYFLFALFFAASTGGERLF